MSDERRRHLLRLNELLDSAVGEYRESDLPAPEGIEIGRDLTLLRARVEGLVKKGEYVNS